MRISDWSSDVCSSDLQERLASKHGKYVPMLVKVAPDLSDDDIDAAARVLGDMRVDGVIATNTTVSRIAVQEDPLARETGGLSGEPLMNKSTAVLRMLRTRLPDSIPLVRSEEHTSQLQSLMR